MVACDEVCTTRDVMEAAGLGRITLYKRIKDGIVLPVISSNGTTRPQFFSFVQALALRKHQEMLELGQTDDAAMAVLKFIENLKTVETVDALVAEGRGYLIVLDGDLWPHALTLSEVHEYMASANRLTALLTPKEQRRHAIATAMVVCFGETWQALKPLLIERAAGQRRPK